DELPICRFRTTGRWNGCSRAGELLDAVVVRIRDVDVPTAVHRDAVGRVELPVARAAAAPRGEEGGRAAELLDAVVERIDDVDVPAPVGRQIGRAVGRAGAHVARARR